MFDSLFFKLILRRAFQNMYLSLCHKPLQWAWQESESICSSSSKCYQQWNKIYKDLVCQTQHTPRTELYKSLKFKHDVTLGNTHN